MANSSTNLKPAEWPPLRRAALTFALAAGMGGAASAEPVRPYEIVRAGRTADEFQPIERLETADGWKVSCDNAVASFTTSAEHALFGGSAARFTWRTTGENPMVRLVAPTPVAVPEGADTMTLWVRGNNLFGNSEYDPPYEKVPMAAIRAEFEGCDGERRTQLLGFVFHKDWHLLAGVVTNGAGGAASLPVGMRFVGFSVTSAVDSAEHAIDMTSLCVFRDPKRPDTTRPRAKRGVQTFPNQPQGLNTGAGSLPFPTRADTVIPPPVQLSADLEFRLPKDACDWGDLAFRYGGSDWLRLAVGGGVFPRRMPAGGRVRFHREGNSLVCDVTSPMPGVEEVRFGRLGAPTGEVTFVEWPYYTYGYHKAVWDPAIPDGYSRNYRPKTAMLDIGGRRLFIGATPDWTQSNASEITIPGVEDAVGTLSSGVLYAPKTDGRRNGCFERFVWTFSEDVVDVLPVIPNPVSPYRDVAGSHSWAVCGTRDYDRQIDYWRAVKAAGIDNVVINDHETQWRDDNESFTFRTEAAPRKGGDAALRAYAQTLTKELGFLYGPYNNFTDYAPVNAYWSIDRASRFCDGKLIPGWNRCYAPKPTWAVGMCERLAPELARKFGFNTGYCDVHTATTPWSRTDYDARSPGAGTFAQVFYCFGEIMLLQKAAWRGPVYSEGGSHWLYSGLIDGNYAQDQRYGFWDRPWLVDFDLRRMHPLCCNFGMGSPGMFYGARGGKIASEDRQLWIDRFTAATLAFGHPGFLVTGRDPGKLDLTKESYFPVQAIASRYTVAEAVSIQYASADGSLHSVSEALANGAAARSQIKVVYSDGTVVAVNGNMSDTFRVEVGGVVYDLPPNGWRAESADGTIVTFNGTEGGRRVKYARCPWYSWTKPDVAAGRSTRR